MARSVVAITQTEFSQMRKFMPNKTDAQRLARKNIDFSSNEREQLEEFVVLLEMFKFMIDELQSNKVTISRMRPCYLYVKNGLLSNIRDKKHTKEFRYSLLKALNKRFEELTNNDLFIVATFLDCHFGLGAFEKKSILKLEKLSKTICHTPVLTVREKSRKVKFSNREMQSIYSRQLIEMTN